MPRDGRRKSAPKNGLKERTENNRKSSDARGKHFAEKAATGTTLQWQT